MSPFPPYSEYREREGERERESVWRNLPVKRARGYANGRIPSHRGWLNFSFLLLLKNCIFALLWVAHRIRSRGGGVFTFIKRARIWQKLIWETRSIHLKEVGETDPRILFSAKDVSLFFVIAGILCGNLTFLERDPVFPKGKKRKRRQNGVSILGGGGKRFLFSFLFFLFSVPFFLLRLCGKLDVVAAVASSVLFSLPIFVAFVARRMWEIRAEKIFSPFPSSCRQRRRREESTDPKCNLDGKNYIYRSLKLLHLINHYLISWKYCRILHHWALLFAGGGPLPPPPQEKKSFFASLFSHFRRGGGRERRPPPSVSSSSSSSSQTTRYQGEATEEEEEEEGKWESFLFSLFARRRRRNLSP